MRVGLLLLVGVLLLAGCATPIEVDYDTQRDFTRLHTYAWLNPPAELRRQDPVLYNSLTENRIRNAGDRILTARGLRRADPAAADCLVTYHLNVEQRIESDHFGYGFGYGWDHYGMMAGTGNDIRQYEEETLMVDLLDAHSRELLWRGAITEPRDRYLSPKEREARILRQMHEILAKYPPKAQ